MNRLLARRAGPAPASASFGPVRNASSFPLAQDSSPARPARGTAARGPAGAGWLGRLLGLGLAVVTGAAAEVHLAWDPSPDPDVTNYRIYWGYQSRTYEGYFDVGNVTNTVIGSLAEGTRYFFAATATTGDGRESDFSNEVEYTTPVPPPAAPTLQLAATSGTEVTLTWTPNSNPTGVSHRVAWGLQSGSYTEFAEAGAATSVVIEFLNPGAIYFFAVKAVSKEGRESTWSNEVSWTVPLPPLAVPVLQLAGGTTSSVTLSWEVAADPAVVNFRVFWGFQPGNYAGYLDVGPATSLVMGPLQAGTTYYFAVQARARDGRVSALSEEVAYSVPLPPPPPPVLMLASETATPRTATPETTVTLLWQPSSDPSVVNYRVFWGTQSRAYDQSLAVGLATSVSLGPLTPGVIYYFAAKAVTADGRESDYSNEVSFRVQAPAAPPVLVGVVSRKAHGGRAEHDLPLALSGWPSVEGRITSTLTLVFRFDKPIADALARVTRGTASITGESVIEGSEVLVTLQGVATRQWLSVQLSGVVAEDGSMADPVTVSLGVLGGDVDGDGVVSQRDEQIVRPLTGQLCNAANFRADVNQTGTLTGADLYAVRMRKGQRLPAW